MAKKKVATVIMINITSDFKIEEVKFQCSANGTIPPNALSMILTKVLAEVERKEVQALTLVMDQRRLH